MRRTHKSESSLTSIIESDLTWKHQPHRASSHVRTRVRKSSLSNEAPLFAGGQWSSPGHEPASFDVKWQPCGRIMDALFWPQRITTCWFLFWNDWGSKAELWNFNFFLLFMVMIYGLDVSYIPPQKVSPCLGWPFLSSTRSIHTTHVGTQGQNLSSCWGKTEREKRGEFWQGPENKHLITCEEWAVEIWGSVLLQRN